jgi:hypothetical protein
MSKKQEQHQNQQQQQHQNLLLRESQKRRGHGRAGSIARASLTVSLDNADTVIEGGPFKPSFGLSGGLARRLLFYPRGVARPSFRLGGFRYDQDPNTASDIDLVNHH